ADELKEADGAAAGPDGVPTTQGMLPHQMFATGTRSFCGVRKIAKAARPRRATLASMNAAASQRVGPRLRSRVSLPETSWTRTSVLGWRRSRKARACPGTDCPAKLSRLRYRLVKCG